jgi:hypothetical protein
MSQRQSVGAAAIKRANVKRSSVTHYDPQQIVLTDDYQAVYTQEEADGSLSLYSRPVLALAVARETRIVRELREGDEVPQVVRRDVSMVVVGMVLVDGYWSAVNECDNFAGLCRNGDDIYRATGCLLPEDHSLVQRPGEPPPSSTATDTGAQT